MVPEPESVGASHVTSADTNSKSSAANPVTLSAKTSEWVSWLPLNALWLALKLEVAGAVVSMVTLRVDDAAETKSESVCVALSDQVPSSRAFGNVQLSVEVLAVKVQLSSNAPLLAVTTTAAPESKDPTETSGSVTEVTLSVALEPESEAAAKSRLVGAGGRT